MAAKTFFLVLLTIGVLQTLRGVKCEPSELNNAKAFVVSKSELSPAAKSDDTKSIFDDIIDKALNLARDAIKYIADTISDIVEQASQAIVNILQTVLGNLNDAQKEAQDILKRLLVSVVAEIEKVKDAAAEVGADIAECIAGREDAAKQIIDEATKGIAACVSDKVSEADHYRRELDGLITDAWKFSENAGNSIMKCFELSGPFRILDCVIAETSRVNKQTVSIVTSIRNKISEVETFALLAVPDLTQCSGAKLLKAQEKVAEILRDIEICVHDKLHPSSSVHKTR